MKSMIVKTSARYAAAGSFITAACVLKEIYAPLGSGVPFLIGFTPIAIITWYGGRACGLFSTVLFIGIVMFMSPRNGLALGQNELIQCVTCLIESAFLVTLIDHSRQALKAETAAKHVLTDQLKAYIAISETVPHMIWWANNDGNNVKVPFMNKQWEEYTGIPAARLNGDGWLRLGILHPQDAAALAPRWREWRVKGEAYTYECRLRDRHGNYRTHLARVKPLLNNRGSILMWIGTMTDIRDEKIAMDNIAQADKRKDEFLAMLAHELRNPLTPIRTCVGLLRKHESVVPELGRMFNIMDRQLRQITRLVDDLMDVSRISQGKITLQAEPLDLTCVIMQAVDAAKTNIDAKKQHLKVDSPKELVWVDGDRVRLVQVFSNLLTNASKYTEKEGCICLGLSVHEGNAVITIEDDGTGIDPKIQPFIFDLFMQVESNIARSQGGLGIGLTLVKRLVGLHGGKVNVFSEGIGKGSTFTVTLPLSKNVVVLDPAVKKDGSGPRSVLRADPLTIVVADDNADSTESLRLFLEGEGHNVESALDGEEAIRKVAMIRPDVVILDIGMPCLNGYEVCQELRNGHPYPEAKNLLIIAATGYGQPNDKELARLCGFDHHLTKPFDFSILLGILAQDQIARKMGVLPQRQTARKLTNESDSHTREARTEFLH